MYRQPGHTTRHITSWHTSRHHIQTVQSLVSSSSPYSHNSLPSIRQHLIYDNCLENKRENSQNYSVLYWISMCRYMPVGIFGVLVYVFIYIVKKPLTDNEWTPSTAILQTLSCRMVIARRACLSIRRLGWSVDIAYSVLSTEDNSLEDGQK